MEINEYRNVTTKQRVLIAIKCDVCGEYIVGDYWKLTTSHNDWGNDSVESCEFFQLCSHSCIRKKLKDYFDDCQSSSTQEFDLEQSYFKPKID